MWVSPAVQYRRLGSRSRQSHYGTFQAPDLDFSIVPFTRTVRGSPEHAPSCIKPFDLIQPISKTQRNSKVQVQPILFFFRHKASLFLERVSFRFQIRAMESVLERPTERRVPRKRSSSLSLKNRPKEPTLQNLERPLYCVKISKSATLQRTIVEDAARDRSNAATTCLCLFRLPPFSFSHVPEERRLSLSLSLSNARALDSQL